MTHTAVLHDAAELVRNDPDADGDGDVADPTADGAVAVEDGTVVAAGSTDRVTRAHPPENADVAVDASGKTLLPGFVDPHTHAVFAGDRADEFTAKLEGATYREIMAEGGGILRTVRAVREAPEATLVSNLLAHLDTMLAHGTTTVEVKSGYGLSTSAELKLLSAVQEADRRHPVGVVPTFMGAHAVPEDRETDAYVERVIDDQLPAIADQGIAEFCDVFCEADVFSVGESRRILQAGRDRGLTPKIHAEEFERIGGARLAADLEAASADHLLRATPDDAEALAAADVTPVLLPGTAFTLGADYADPDRFAAVDRPVAIATDFNPNCFSQSVEFAVDLACHGMRMTPREAIRAATATAAEAIDRTDGTGRLVPGAPGDVVVADVPDHEHVPYNFGVRTVETVLKGGEVVHRAG